MTITSETNFLDFEEDRYADTTELCKKCGLPKVIMSYEIGFSLLRQQLEELKRELKSMSDRLGIVD